MCCDKMSDQPPPKKIKLEENSEDMSEVLLPSFTESSFNDDDVIVQPSSDMDQDPTRGEEQGDGGEDLTVMTNFVNQCNW